MSKYKKINIGKIIEEYVRANKINIAKMSKETNISRSNIYDMFEKESIHTDIIVRLSNYLNHNFFNDIANTMSIDSNKEDNDNNNNNVC